jgi:putative membrane protein
MFELLIPLLIGIILGIVTGLLPGIHTNLLSTILVALSSFFLKIFSPIELVTLIVAMGITNTFIDTIPSIYLGAPDEDSALSILPGHRMLLEGKGHEAVCYTVIGSAVAIILFVALTPLLFFVLPITQSFFERMMAFLLIWTCIFLIWKEKESRERSIFVFFLAGFLGIASLNMGANQPLLPLLTGLFGISTLIFSISCKSKIPPQKTDFPSINPKELTKPTLATAIVSPICSFLPGLGASQSALIGSELFKKMKPSSFLILVGSTNTLVLATSFVILYLTNKKRTGIAGAISEIMRLNFRELIVIIVITLITSAISIFLAIKISKLFAKYLHRLDYPKLSKIVIIFLTLVTLFIGGFKGLMILAGSTFLGLAATYLGVRKGFLMGCLLVPTILFYLPI